MSSFAKAIKRGDETLFFRFSRIQTPRGLRYQINLLSEVPLYFQMEEGRNGWRFIQAPKVPDWLLPWEGELSKAIEEEEKNTL